MREHTQINIVVLIISNPPSSIGMQKQKSKGPMYGDLVNVLVAALQLSFQNIRLGWGWS